MCEKLTVRRVFNDIKRRRTYMKLVKVFKMSGAIENTKGTKTSYIWDLPTDPENLKRCVYLEISYVGKNYVYEVYIENEEGFTCVDIAVLIWDIEDHDWCWKWLNMVGITKYMLGLKDGKQKKKT